MAGLEGSGKRRRKAGAANRPRPDAEEESSRRENGDGGKDGASLVAALGHEVRREILRHLHDSDEPRSPARVAERLSCPLSDVSYHFKALRRLRLVTMVDEVQVRGAVEHFYVSGVADDPVVLDVLERTRAADEELLGGDAES